MSGRILFVDDDPFILRALARSLEFDYELETAESAFEALELLENDPEFRIVVTDINMPGMDGIELARKIGVLWPHITCVMLSGNQQGEVAARVNELKNVFRFLHKPSARQEVASCIDELLGSNR